jgi:hypothetical protein
MRKIAARAATLLFVAATALVGAGSAASAVPPFHAGVARYGGAAGPSASFPIRTGRLSTGFRGGIGARATVSPSMAKSSMLRRERSNRVALHPPYSRSHHHSSGSTVHRSDRSVNSALVRRASGSAATGGAHAHKAAARRETVLSRVAAKPSGVGLSRSQAALGGSSSGPVYLRPRHHGGFVGWSGGLFWPHAYDDIFDYTLWPYDYDQIFWAYAYADVYNSIIWPYGYDDPVGSIGLPGGRLTHSQDRPRRGGRICDERTPGLTDWPIERIERTVHPTPGQQAALDELKSASAQALQALQAACPTETISTPLARLEAMEKRLESMLRAVVGIVRPALANFYNSLRDEQKASFDAIGYATASARRETRPSRDSEEQRPTQFCRGDHGPALSEQSIRRIEQVVRPSGSQRAALDDLKYVSAKAIETLQSACPKGIPTTPLARLDALQQRVDAMAKSVKMVRPVMDHFYASLGDAQKTHFDMIGSRKTPAPTLGETR